MPEKCVVFGCSNVRNKQKGIKLHPIPFYGKSDSEKQRRRKKWVDFVKLKRAHWEATEHSAVCSEHFKEEDFTNRFSEDLDRRLRRDEIGVSVFPTKHAHSVSNDQTAESQRSKRKRRKEAMESLESTMSSTKIVVKHFNDHVIDHVIVFHILSIL
ncbi:THAP domain-containing protein 5-like [Acropora millepora]|uniref:THAP domain-containing protein 5-like n=1 Tax=Acropora millepora TaxID=45264 RepID=UPI001CF21890|nr:THAP domain-containing protein 5-like [Acropora millepora]